MAGCILISAAAMQCTHGGVARATTSNPRVKVAGQPVLTQTDGLIISGCPYIVHVEKDRMARPCVTATWITAASRVHAAGSRVLLQDSQAVTAPNAVAVNIAMTQTRVKAL